MGQVIEIQKTLRDVKSAAAKVGASVEDSIDGNSHTCSVGAPKGLKWKCGDIHELVDVCYTPWKPDYADLLTRMGYGLELCSHPECDWCCS